VEKHLSITLTHSTCCNLHKNPTDHAYTMQRIMQSTHGTYYILLAISYCK
jgi:hypothetical protein